MPTSHHNERHIKSHDRDCMRPLHHPPPLIGAMALHCPTVCGIKIKLSWRGIIGDYCAASAGWSMPHDYNVVLMMMVVGIRYITRLSRFFLAQLEECSHLGPVRLSSPYFLSFFFFLPFCTFNVFFLFFSRLPVCLRLKVRISKNPICSACMLRYCRSGSDKKKVLLLQAQDNCAADRGVGRGKK